MVFFFFVKRWINFNYLLKAKMWLNWFSGKAGFHHWPEDPDERGPAKLGQGVQTAAGPEKRKNHSFLLRSPATRSAPARQVRSVWIRFPERSFLDGNWIRATSLLYYYLILSLLVLRFKYVFLVHPCPVNYIILCVCVCVCALTFCRFAQNRLRVTIFFFCQKKKRLQNMLPYYRIRLIITFFM